MSENAIKTDVKAAWSDLDVAAARRVKDWLEHDNQKKRGMGLSALAREAGMNVSTLHAVVHATYPSSPTRWLARLTEAIERLAERAALALRIPFVETTVWRLVNSACVRAQAYGAGSVVAAYVGTGKTECLREYQRRHEQVYLVESPPRMKSDLLLRRLIDATGAEVHRSQPYSQRTDAIIEKLHGTQGLLILDEADKCAPDTLETLRRICDLSGVGFVLSGTEDLKPLVREPEGRFGQVSSRITYWPKTVQGITPGDCRKLADAALGQDVELTEDHYAAFIDACDGSARVLVRGLIPGVRDFILKKKVPLTGKAVTEVCRQILGFERPARRVREPVRGLADGAEAQA